MKHYNKKTSLINTVIFFTIVIFINLISLNIFFRLDFSKGKIYSLSNSSKDAVRHLDDRLIVKAYFTKELPPQFANIRRYTRDLLEEYKNASNGRFRYEFINPTDENNLKAEAQKNGIPPVNVQVREQDRLEVREAFLGLVFFYEDKTEVIPLVQETRGLEYEITKTINRLTSKNIPKIAFFGSENDLSADPRLRFFFQQQDEHSRVKERIKQNYNLIITNLEDPLEDHISTLIIPGTKDSLSIQQIFNIDQFLMKGNNLLVFQDGVDANLQMQMAQTLKTNFLDLLKHYNINIKENLVLDAHCGQINIQEQRGIFTVSTPMEYPFIPIVTNFNKNNTITSQLNSLQFVFASEIETEVFSEKVKITPLVFSSERSSTIYGPFFNIGIDQFKNRNFIAGFKQKNIVMATLHEGEFNSFFDENFDYLYDEDLIRNTDYAKIITVSDMNFIKNNGSINNPDNLNFVMNSLDYLNNNQELISLRSREVANKPLRIEKIINVENLNPKEAEEKINRYRSIVKSSNMILPTFLLIIYGLIRYKKELLKRKRIKEIYE